jgi:hypothetical protein
MNTKLSTIAAIIAAAALTGILSPAPMTVYADETETSTDQLLAQKNVGSGDAVNFNCAENLIKAGVDDQNCEFGEDGGGDGGMNGGGGNGGGGNGGGGEEEPLVDICHVSASGNEINQQHTQSTADNHVAQHNGPPGSGPDYYGMCDGRTPPR